MTVTGQAGGAAQPTDRVWSEFGYLPQERVEQLRAEEVAGADQCLCGHPRRDHFPDRCGHLVSRYRPSRFQAECACTGFEDA